MISVDETAVNGDLRPIDAPAKPAGPDDLFRLVYRLVEDIQRVRLAHGNRVRQVLPLIPESIKPPRGSAGWSAFFEAGAEALESEEARILSLAQRLLKDDRLGRWLLSQKGIGPALGVSILGECWPLSRFASPRKLWAYAGLAVGEDGKAVRRKKGVKSNWNSRLKTRLYLFSVSIVKAGGPWRELYDQRKAYEWARIGAHLLRDGHGLFAPDPDPGAAGGAHAMSDSQLVNEPAGGPAQHGCDSHSSHEQVAGAHVMPARPMKLEPGLAPPRPGSQSQREQAVGARVSCDPSGQTCHEPDGTQAGAHTGDAGPTQGEPGPESAMELPSACALSRLDGHDEREPGDGSPKKGLKAQLHMRAMRYCQKALLKDLWRVANDQEPLVGRVA